MTTPRGRTRLRSRAAAPTTGAAPASEPRGIGRGGGLGLAGLRIALGVLWLTQAAWKVPPDFGRAARTGLWARTQDAMTYPMFAPYTWFVENVVTPNFILFGWLTFLAEAAIGGFLLVGLGTRFWGLFGAFQALAMGLLVMNRPGEWTLAWWAIVFAHLAIAAVGAGRWGGVDGALRPRWHDSDKALARILERLS